jgi:hypothetical protein
MPFKELIRRKQKGERIEPERLAQPTNVINLRDAAELGDRRRRPEEPARLATRRLKAAAARKRSNTKQSKAG